MFSACCAEAVDRLPYWAPMGFYSGQGLCVLCWQSVVQSNEQIYKGFRGKVGRLAPKQCIDGREKEGGNQTATGEWHGGIYEC